MCVGKWLKLQDKVEFIRFYDISVCPLNEANRGRSGHFLLTYLGNTAQDRTDPS